MAKKKSTGKKPGGAKGRKKAAQSDVAATSEKPKARTTKAAAVKGGAKKAAAPVKLNDKQRDLLGKIKGAGEPGYTIGQKIEQRTINALHERKLIKRGAKNKETGTTPYVLTKAGEKNLGSGASESTP